MPDNELDIQVAEKVFGCKVSLTEQIGADYNVECGCENYEHTDDAFGIAPYSSDIYYAWQIVEKLIRREDGIPPTFDLSRNEEAVWWCYFDGQGAGVSNIAPRAICLAALERCKRINARP